MSMVLNVRRSEEELLDELAAAVAEIDPLVPIADVTTVEQVVSGTQARERFGTAVMSALAGPAVVLVTLGLYGSMSRLAGERARDVAVRVAMGSGRLCVAGMIAAVGARAAGLGLLIGGAASYAAGRALAPLLFGVPPHDAVTLLVTVATIVTVTAIACLPPMLSVLRSDPLDVLRA